MKWFPCLILLAFVPFAHLPAAEEGELAWDIDSVFDENSPLVPPGETESVTRNETENAGSTIKNMIQRRGLNFTASYEFIAGIAPGWRQPPWVETVDHGFYLDRYIKMKNSLALDAQISESFRVRTDVYFEIPQFSFKLADFFFDYTVADTVFVRGGKYALSWGISPNYGFTNLLSRIPRNEPSGDSFIVKADIPSGIGGFQVLALTRAPLMAGVPLLEKEDFGYGAKYNLALRSVDLDTGFFYQDGMALRGFLSLKTTLWKTELYSEGLLAIDTIEPSNTSGAVNLGFGRDFFGGSFNINGELFFNHEKDVYWFRPETNIREEGPSPFIEGFNIALNMQYKFALKGDPRFFLQLRYAPLQSSAQIIPGFRLTPWTHLELYLAVPMALGPADAYYYQHTPIVDTVENKPVPFCVMLLVTLSGSVQFGHYY